MTPLRIIGTGGKPKLPKVFKRKWVEALRSGKFEQAHGVLHVQSLNSFCCLGVGCVVAGCADLKRMSEHGYPDSIEIGEKVHAVISTLIPQPEFGQSKIGDVLWRLNDSERKSFTEIADWIEEHL